MPCRQRSKKAGPGPLKQEMAQQHLKERKVKRKALPLIDFGSALLWSGREQPDDGSSSTSRLLAFCTAARR